MSVVLSARAEDDLRAIGRWIRQDDAVRAISFIAEIEARVSELAFMSRRHQRISAPDVAPALHRFVHGRYRIYYRVSGADDVVVVTVWSTSRAEPDLSA